LGNAEKRKRREKERQKERARRRAIAEGGPNAPNRIFYPYPTPEALIAIGPVIVAAWAIPQALAQALVAAGQAIPRPVEGLMLVDTGAQSTCISESAAQALGLQPIRLTKTYGAAGLHENKVYEAHLQIGIDDGKGVRSDFHIEMQTICIPQLHEQMRGVKINNVERPLIGLLGRDFLRHTKLTYNGTGSVEILVNPDAFGGPRDGPPALPPGM
jgi:predicted aspartyl protease